ncbi:MAG: zinc-ribbon domain-containing protein [Clostridiales bacterium]|nr:zinc-ribbon domain-containing protein [Clostridiales bacterium]
MKKSTKITLLVVAVFTVIGIIATIVMFNAIAGDALFYMNSKLGNIYAVSYRWVSLESVIFIFFWILLIVKKRKIIANTLSKYWQSKKGTKETITEGAVATPSFAISLLKPKILCKNCGKEVPKKNKFCKFCGEAVPLSKKTK